MKYLIFAAIVAALFKRPLRKFLYGIVGILLFALALVASVFDGFSLMEISKLEMLFLVGIVLVSRKNMLLDRQVNKDWFLSTKIGINLGWLYSKYTDFIWIGLIPFYIFLLIIANLLIKDSDFQGQSDVFILFNPAIFSAVLLTYMLFILILRNICLRFLLSRMNPESQENSSTSLEQRENSNG